MDPAVVPGTLPCKQTELVDATLSTAELVTMEQISIVSLQHQDAQLILPLTNLEIANATNTTLQLSL